MMFPRRWFVLPFLLLAFGVLSCSDRLAPVTEDSGADSARSGSPDTDYGVAVIGTLGGESGIARGINNRNEVVGMARNAADDIRAFRWRDGTIEELPGLGGSVSGAYGINNRGWIVGEAENAQGEMRAVLWVNGEPLELGTLGGSFSQALAVNQRGQVVGVAANSEEEPRPFLWWRGQMEELPLPPSEELVFASAEGINNRGQIVGTRAGFFGHAIQDALLWTRGEVSFLESPCLEYGAFDINERGQIVGGGLSCPIATEIVPLLWDRNESSEYLEPLGGLQELGEFGGQNTGRASAVNARGQIVGSSDAAPDVFEVEIRATLWYRDEVIDLGGEPDFAGAEDINERSVAVGRSGGLPAIFFPDSEREIVAGLARRAIDRRAVPAAPDREMGDALFGSRAGEEWAVKLCRLRGGVTGAPTAAEILAGC